MDVARSAGDRFCCAQRARVNSGWRLTLDSVFMRLRSSFRIVPVAETRIEPKGSSPAVRAEDARSMQRVRWALSWEVIISISKCFWG